MREEEIRQEVFGKVQKIEVFEDWMTPAGRPRTVPMYEANIANDVIGKSRTIKGKDRADVIDKAREQLNKWGELEVKQRTQEAAELQDELAKKELQSIEHLLHATLDVDDRLDWNAMLQTDPFAEFSFELEPPPLPLVKKPWYLYLLPFLTRFWEAKCEKAAIRKKSEVADWRKRRDQAFADYERKKTGFLQAQNKHNEQVRTAREQYETCAPGAVEEYLAAVFERSSYPEGFFLEHAVAYDKTSQTSVVDVELPPQSKVPDITGYKFVKSSGEVTPIKLKPKQHAELYDSAIKQCVLRTLHEVFESDYAGHAGACVVNGFVTAIDGATGKEKKTCIISVSSEREVFESFDLSRIDPSECIKGLKGLLAGPLSEVAPVRPILQLNREDGRFVESRDVLDDVGEQNLAEMDWEEFEHLVRELCSKMFSTEGAEVKVTQASRDKGVDAIAFDPDPIRGGKFVVQAKRYTKVVPVSAVRDLYGTVINEGATRGILVTTAHYGRDSREFAKDKPLTLIDGSNLVHLLEEHGYKVRLDVKAARAVR